MIPIVFTVPLSALFAFWWVPLALCVAFVACDWLGETVGVCLWTLWLLAGSARARAAWLADDWAAKDLRKRYPWLTRLANWRS